MFGFTFNPDRITSPLIEATPNSFFENHFSSKCENRSSSAQAKRRLFTCVEPDIEDYGNLVSTRKTEKKKKKKPRIADTLLDRFRSKKGLFVTDLTKTEWCEKQMELSLFSKEWNNGEALGFVGGKINSEAMQAGIDRHVQLQHEIQIPVDVNLKSHEDHMALKLINFINGVNQLLFEGLTRELPIVSFASAQGIWMVGKIDEVRMLKAKKYHHKPVLVETKTRFRDTVPSEPQKRNGRLQVMCYKYLWDNLVTHTNFPSKELFDYFELNPRRVLCKDLQEAGSKSGISARTLGDVVTCYQNTCKMMLPAHDELVLRYESQRDQSLLYEEKFLYDGGWIQNMIQNCLEFWLGQREAGYVDEEEHWKCRYCNFSSECPAYTDTESTETSSGDDSSDCYY